jgi:aryl-alcohol dehydrogenase-like predicted oxidoreductase
MRYRSLGTSGLVVSVLGLGCNNIGRDLDAAATQTLVNAALDCGITLFDTADTYPRPVGVCEELLGQALSGRRDEVVLATKFGSDMRGDNGPDWGARGSRRYIRRAVQGSLRRLRTDWIDLYQYHTPDLVTPIEETLSALHELVVEGKVRYIGSSNLKAWQLVEADFLARHGDRTRFVSAQNRYNLLERDAENELIPACQSYGVGLLPYYPLANGLLTGKHRRTEPPVAGSRIAEREPAIHTDADWDLIERLESFAIERGLTLLEVALAGLAAQPAVSSVIAGAKTTEQLRANVAAIDWQPSIAELLELRHAISGDQ